jgi:signal peptidase I
VVSTILLFMLAPIIALSITAFAFQSYQVDGESMETTLQNNDRLIVDKIPRTIARITNHPYIPHRGDIVIFNQGGLFDSASGEKQLIKRVIGLPGDRVFIKDGFITIYNNENPGGFNPDKSGLYTIAASNTSGNINTTLKNDEVFVCGDNRPNSEDSRAFGPVNTNNIVGKLSLRLLPISKAQRY